MQVKQTIYISQAYLLLLLFPRRREHGDAAVDHLLVEVALVRLELHPEPVLVPVRAQAMMLLLMQLLLMLLLQQHLLLLLLGGCVPLRYLLLEVRHRRVDLLPWLLLLLLLMLLLLLLLRCGVGAAGGGEGVCAAQRFGRAGGVAAALQRLHALRHGYAAPAEVGWVVVQC